MAQLSTTTILSGRHTRRHRCLVQYLTACGEWELESLDRTNPIIRNATLDEIDLAIAEASRRSRCPLEAKLSKWMGAANDFSIAVKPELWLPIQEAKYLNLQPTEVSARMFLLSNHLECFQIHHRECEQFMWIYHVQPLTTPTYAAYYRWMRGSHNHERLLSVPENEAPPQRNMMGSISTSVSAFIANHSSFEKVTVTEMPLHESIASFLNTL